MSTIAGILAPPAWTEEALCAEVSGDLWYPEKEAREGERASYVREAKAICARCPVRAQCLEHALDTDERFGVWGGYSERDRRRMQHDPEARAAALADIAATDVAPAVIPERPRISAIGETRPVRAAHHDDPPEESPTTPPPATSQDEQDDPMAHHPDYIRQMADIMAATENHPDPQVKAARKQVANAFVALNKQLQASPVTEAARHRQDLEQELRAVEKRGGRGGARPRTAKVKATAGDGVKKVAARLDELGITAKQVRTWAVDAGLPDVPTRGAIPARLIDVWIDAHRQAAS